MDVNTLVHIKMRYDVAAFNLYTFGEKQKNMLDKISGLNLNEKADHEPEVFFSIKEGQIFDQKLWSYIEFGSRTKKDF